MGYEEGYRNGHLDRMLDIEPLNTALYSRSQEYAAGYYDGYHGLTKLQK